MITLMCAAAEEQRLKGGRSRSRMETILDDLAVKKSPEPIFADAEKILTVSSCLAHLLLKSAASLTIEKSKASGNDRR